MGVTHFSGIDAKVLKINGTQVDAVNLSGVTASAEEINVLDGITASTAELNKLTNAGAILASGTRAELIPDPTGGTTVDTEARTAINAIIDALQAFGIVATS
jgi:hypothetical protein